MRILLGLTVFSFISLSACQPKDIKIENPRFSKNNSNSAGASSLGKSEVSHEDMFQYALTRLHQGVQLSRLNSNVDSCVKYRLLEEDAHHRKVSLSYHECALNQSAQSEGLSIVGDRAIYELTMFRKDSEKDFTIDNLKTVTLTTVSLLNVNIKPVAPSSRRGEVNLNESMYLQLYKIEDSNSFEMIFNVDANFSEFISAKDWDSNNKGLQKVNFVGELFYDAAEKKLTKVELHKFFAEDKRDKTIFPKAKGAQSSLISQNLLIDLKYKKLNEVVLPKYTLDIQEEECWMLSGQGLLKKVKNGFESHFEEKSDEKIENAGSTGKDVVLFDLNKEQLSVGPIVTKWPACANIKPSGLDVAYGAIFLK